MERNTIIEALRAANGNVGRAAHALGVSRRTLQNRMREHGMTRSKGGRPKVKLARARRAQSAAGALGIAAAIGGALFVGTKLGGKSNA